MKEALVVGAGGHAKVVLATLDALGVPVAGVLDDAPASDEVLGVRVLGPVALLADHAGPAVLAIGSNAVRQRLAEAYSQVDWLTAVHPSAVVHASVRIGAGSLVAAGAVVQPDAVIGRHVILNTGATVDHDSRVGDFAHVAPGVHLSGGVTVGEGGFLGVGSCAIPGVTVGAWATVGAGAAVVRDLPARTTSVGVPARPRDRL